MTQIPSRIATAIIGLLLFASAWFTIAGRLDWWQGWSLLFVFTGFVTILSLQVARMDPELFRERNRPAAEAEPWDRAVMTVYTLLLILQLLVAALDGGRFRWCPVSPAVQGLGWLLLIFTGMVIWQVMMVNAFLSSWSRLQPERGQEVVKEGLYQYVRHPMYLGIMVAFVGLPLALGSWWALIFTPPMIGLFVYRTYREDKVLKENLNGYREYAQEVRFRLLPGIW